MSVILEQHQVDKMLSESIAGYKSKYADYISAANNAYLEATGRKMPSNLELTVAKNLAATEQYFQEAGYSTEAKYLKETTDPSDINAFIHHAFDMVTAIIPSTIIDEMVSIQGMDKRVGEIFYMDILVGTNKGYYQQGQEYLSSQYGPRTGQSYSDDRVTEEPFNTQPAPVSNTTTTYTTVLAWSPVVINNTVPNLLTFDYWIGGVQYTGQYDGTTFSGYDVNAGSCHWTASTQTLVIVFTTALDSGTLLDVNYYWNGAVATTGSTTSGLPEVNVELTSSIVTAKRRALKTKWLLDAAAMLAKEHGKDIEKELMDSVIAGVMNETAVEVAADIYNSAAAGAPVTFSNTPPSLQIPYVIHRQELFASIIDADTNIESSVRKVKANFVVGGSQFSNIVKGMPVDMFKPAEYSDAVPVGMHVIGKLNNQYKCIQNFDYPTTAFLVGAKGNNWLTTGYVYAPFIPLMTTKPITDENLVTWRSLLTWYGKKIVNASFYNQGIITA